MLPNKKVLAAILVAAGAFVLLGAGKASVTNEDAHTLVKQGALLLDVRTPGEYSSGHIEGAVNIPVQELESRMGSLPPKKDAPIVIYCQSGRRSSMAREMLMKAGYTKVHDLGAMANWR